MSSNYRSNIALVYGIQPRTLKKRAEKVGLLKVLPQFGHHKALFHSKDIALIYQFLGPPELNIRRMC
jgi:hypothetical protein